MKLTFYGHACFSVEIKGKHILFDPYITPNDLAKDIDINSIPADYIPVSHGHEDHVVDVVAIAQRTGAKVIGGYEVASWYSNNGVSNVQAMNHGGKWDFDFGTIKLVDAVHSSSFPDGTYGGNAVGFVITSDEGNFYFAGDTALTMDMQLIPKIAKMNFAMLPIGDVFTMGYEDAVTAASFIECNQIYGMHYDTFEPIKIDHQAAIDAFSSVGKELILMNIGETVEVGSTAEAN